MVNDGEDEKKKKSGEMARTMDRFGSYDFAYDETGPTTGQEAGGKWRIAVGRVPGSERLRTKKAKLLGI